jgi:glutamate dehydrogenase/leucine dehydrogenase
MKSAFHDVYIQGRAKKVDLRTAAYLLAVQRVAEAVAARQGISLK